MMHTSSGLGVSPVLYLATSFIRTLADELSTIVEQAEHDEDAKRAALDAFAALPRVRIIDARVVRPKLKAAGNPMYTARPTTPSVRPDSIRDG